MKIKRDGIYIGINRYKGIDIPEEEAFGYALDSIRSDRKTFFDFIAQFKSRLTQFDLSDWDRFQEFAEDVVEWFFSGDWIHEEREV